MIKEIRIYTTTNRLVSIEHPIGEHVARDCADAIREGRPIVLLSAGKPDRIINPEYVELIEIEYIRDLEFADQQAAAPASMEWCERGGVFQLGA